MKDHNLTHAEKNYLQLKKSAEKQTKRFNELVINLTLDQKAQLAEICKRAGRESSNKLNLWLKQNHEEKINGAIV